MKSKQPEIMSAEERRALMTAPITRGILAEQRYESKFAAAGGNSSSLPTDMVSMSGHGRRFRKLPTGN